ncbi:MAG: hypothetical protein ACOCP4_00135 [Candidatus Woesearchaeota archaeon]
MKYKKYLLYFIIFLSIFTFRSGFNRFINPNSLGYISLNNHLGSNLDNLDDLNLDSYSNNRVRYLFFFNQIFNLDLTFHIFLSFLYVFCIVLSLLVLHKFTKNVLFSILFIFSLLYLPFFKSSLASIDFEIIFIFSYLVIVILFNQGLDNKYLFYFLTFFSFIFTSLFIESFLLLLSFILFFIFTSISKRKFEKENLEFFFIFLIFFFWNFLHYFFYHTNTLNPKIFYVSFNPVIGFFIILSLLNVFSYLFKNKDKLFIFISSNFLILFPIWIFTNRFFGLLFIFSVILSFDYIQKLKEIKFSSISKYMYKLSLILLFAIVFFNVLFLFSFFNNHTTYEHVFYPGYNNQFYYSDYSFFFLSYSRNIEKQIIYNSIFEDLNRFDFDFYENLGINSFFIFNPEKYDFNKSKYATIEHNDFKFFYND